MLVLSLLASPALAGEVITMRQYLDNAQTRIETASISDCIYEDGGCTHLRVVGDFLDDCSALSASYDFDIENAEYTVDNLRFETAADRITGDLTVNADMDGMINVWRRALFPCDPLDGGCRQATCEDGSTEFYKLMVWTSVFITGADHAITGHYGGTSTFRTVPREHPATDRWAFRATNDLYPGPNGESDGLGLDTSNVSLSVASPVSALVVLGFGFPWATALWNDVRETIKDAFVLQLSYDAFSASHNVLEADTMMQHQNNYVLDAGLDLGGSSSATVLVDTLSVVPTYIENPVPTDEIWDLEAEVSWDTLPDAGGDSVGNRLDDTSIYHFGMNIPDGHANTLLLAAHGAGAFDHVDVIPTFEYQTWLPDLGSGNVTMSATSRVAPRVVFQGGNASVHFDLTTSAEYQGDVITWSGAVSVPVTPTLLTVGGKTVVALVPDWSSIGFVTQSSDFTAFPSQTMSDWHAALGHYLPGRLMPDPLLLIRTGVDDHAGTSLSGPQPLLGTTVDMSWDTDGGNLLVYFD